ncbi:MAG: UDP-N-acetylglucosamine 2-epimerase (non-hydrolyzing) [Salinivirgaceae bacterium]|nr:UDP-N-acetylglucosamine 2-epimerase (non-hydrolyzing) [Salinivirgaceae bacterium]
MAKKIVTIVGARPQFIKAAAVSRELIKAGIEEKIIHTGQHFDDNMSKVFFDEMEIPKPHYNLDIHSLSHGAMTGRMIEEIEKILLIEKPDYLIVYGDTNSTLAGALAAQKLQIPIAHVEAGLRSFNMKMPEETNRILTDRISNLLFCPTDNAIENLKNEGFDNFTCKVIRTGDVMQDAAIFYDKMSYEKSLIINQLNLSHSNFVLCTLHRQENTDDINRLQNIIEALNILSEKYTIVLPLHPRTRNIIAKNNIKLKFKPIDPVGYFDMIQLIKNSKFIITDSGGLQKEAFFFKKFCITTRDETEWVELVKNGFNVVVGANKDKILHEANQLINKTADFDVDLYGNGKASKRIVSVLQESY